MRYLVSDLSSPKGKKKEDTPIVPLSNPFAMYYNKDGELNPPLE